jgi:hypothetical protein
MIEQGYTMISEAQEQVYIFDWAELQKKAMPELGLLFAIPNGGSRHPLEAKNLKRQGVKAGVPDMFLPVARNGFNGLFIELKRSKKSGASRLRKEQKEWLNCLFVQGYKCVVCYGFDEVKTELENYLR